jgi:integrase
LERLRQRRDGGISPVETRLPLREYLPQWLAKHQHRFGSQTQRTYRGHAARITAHLGHVSLGKLNAAHIDGLLDTLRVSGSAVITRQRTLAFLRAVCNDAVKRGVLARSPAAAITPPTGQTVRMRPLRKDQARALLAAAAAWPHREGVFVLATTMGMRLGEVLGLTWPCVDLEQGRVRIEVSAKFEKGRGAVLGTPKTAYSRRTLPVPAPTLAVLRRMYDERLSDGLLFPTRTGRIQYGSHVEHEWLPKVLHAAFGDQAPDICMHDLRHTFATLALEAGTPAKIVAEMLGHSNVAITLDRYSHVTDGLRRGMIATLDGIFGPTAVSTATQSPSSP